MGTLYDDFDFESSPRGKPIRELIGASFTLTDPRNRLVLSPARNVNYGFAVGELCWYLRGNNDLRTMQYYNRRMVQFSDDGETINSAYGYRMFKPFHSTCSQWEHVIQELKNDPASRRAVMHINHPSDLVRATEQGSKDVPCTMSIQLFIRDRKLHMHVHMRSNDAVWGMPYDVFSFTCLQEYFLGRLQEVGVKVDDLGHYHHSAGSLHIYDTHFEVAREISLEKTGASSPMARIAPDALLVLATEDEPVLRLDTWADMWATGNYDPSVDSIGWMFRQLVDHKNKRIQEELKKREREEALDELAKQTEDLGLYEKETDERNQD